MSSGRPVVVRPDDELISTGAAAELLGTSRQHIVDLCEKGQLPFLSAGTHRRIRRLDVASLQQRGADAPRLTRDQLRSLWLHRAVAGKVLLNPNRALSCASQNLNRMLDVHRRGQAAYWLGEWQRLLGGSLEDILDALTSSSGRAVDLRQNSPFAGILTDNERHKVLSSFRERSR